MYETSSSLMLALECQVDGKVWQEFVDVYQPFLRYLFRQGGIPASDLEDIVQDAFLKLWRLWSNGFQRDKGRGRLRGFLRVLVRNQIVDWFRKRRWQEQSLSSVPETAVSSEASFELLHRSHVLRTAMAAIRLQCRASTWACFERHTVQQVAAEEVARDLGISVNAVYINSSRVLARVRDFCQQYGESLS